MTSHHNSDDVPHDLPQAVPLADFDAEHGTVHASIDIAAPLERVFTALLDPRELAAWWGSVDTYRTRDWHVDPQVGGEWSTRTVGPSDEEATVRGEYLVVDAPHVLEYTWRASWNDFAPTRVRYELAPTLVHGVSGTRLTVAHTGFYGFVGCAGTGSMQTLAWTRVLGQLARSADICGALGCVLALAA
ncbi:MAG: SRPBCC family protein [Gemmatimonadaceae bacterium]